MFSIPQKGRYWNEIISRRYLFNRNVVESTLLGKIKKSALISFFDAHIAAEGRSRRKLSCRVFGKNEEMSTTAMLGEGVDKGVTVIGEDDVGFRNLERLWPLAANKIDFDSFKWDMKEEKGEM